MTIKTIAFTMKHDVVNCLDFISINSFQLQEVQNLDWVSIGLIIGGVNMVKLNYKIN